MHNVTIQYTHIIHCETIVPIELLNTSITSSTYLECEQECQISFL